MKAGSQSARQLPVTVNTPLPTQVHSQNQVQEHMLHRLMQHWYFMFPHSPQLNGFAFRPGVHTLRHVSRFVSFGACQAQRVKMSRQWTTPRLTDLATWEAYLRHLDFYRLSPRHSSALQMIQRDVMVGMDLQETGRRLSLKSCGT